MTRSKKRYPTARDSCQRCKRARKIPGERFCGYCRKWIIHNMIEDGYLTPHGINPRFNGGEQ